MRASVLSAVCFVFIGLFATSDLKAKPLTQDITEEVRSRVRAIVQDAKDLGWTEVAGVKLEELESCLGVLSARIEPEWVQISFSGRKTAYYRITPAGAKIHESNGTITVTEREERLIAFNAQARREIPPDLLPYIDTHETVGVLFPGKEDQYYQTVLRLQAIQIGKIRADSNDPKHAYLTRQDWTPDLNLSTNAPKPFQVAGGAVKVGGGGDWREYELKKRVLGQLDAWLAENKESVEKMKPKFDPSAFQVYLLNANLRIGKFDQIYEVNPFGKHDPNRLHADRYEVNLNREHWKVMSPEQRDKLALKIVDDLFNEYLKDLLIWMRRMTEVLKGMPSKKPC